MSNVLTMAKILSIQQLHALGWTQRRIAVELNVDRATVAKYLQSAPSDPKPANVPAGSAGSKPATFSCPPAPASGTTDGDDVVECAAGSSVAIPPTGLSERNIASTAAESVAARGRRSQCVPFRELIVAKLEQAAAVRPKDLARPCG